MKDYRLPKDFAEKWIEALRSGNYQQGNGYLYLSGAYCCLGVACIVGGVEKEEISDICLIDGSILENVTPEEIHGEASLATTLAKLNDDGESFEYIASWIEENVELYKPLTNDTKKSTGNHRNDHDYGIIDQ